MLPEGKIICLLGTNGCGKTTLLKTALGIIPPLAGQILLKNKFLSDWDAKSLAQYIGYVPQAHQAMFAFSVEQVVLMGRTMHLNWYSTPKAKDLEIVEQSLETLGIRSLQHRNYMELSGGEQQLVLIARALAQQPQCLMMDEPTSNLDFGNQIRVLEQIKCLNQQGMSILMTTHQPEHAYHIADMVVLMKKGRIIAQGEPDVVMTNQALAEIYGVSANQIDHYLPIIEEF